MRDKNKDFWYNNKAKTRFLEVDNSNYTPRANEKVKCKRCNTWIDPPTNSWISQCKNCKTLVSFFFPTNIQQAACLAQCNILINVGSYGSGKTTISAYKIAMSIRDIPNCKVICVAQTKQQLEKNAVPELRKFFHDSEFEKENNEYWVMSNGANIEFWPSDDADKLRSANANFIWIIEGHTPQMKKMYNEALARIRNQLGNVYEYDENGNVKYYTTLKGETKPIITKSKNFVIVEANPVKGAWTSKEILQAHTLIYTTNVKGMDLIKYQAKPRREFDEDSGKEMNVDMISLLNATIDNPTLPSSYWINLKATSYSQDDYDQKVYCDITAKDGLVYQQVAKEPFKYFKNTNEIYLDRYSNDSCFVEGFDLGGSNVNNDPDAYLLGVFNKQTKQLHIVGEMKQSGLNVDETCNLIRQVRANNGWVKPKHLMMVADNAIGRSSKTNRTQSIKNEFEIRLTTPITSCNDKNISYGTKMVNHWINVGALTFDMSLDKLRNEIINYDFNIVEEKVKGSEATIQKQVYSDINNHLLDALRYMVVMLESMGYRQDQANIDYYKMEINQQNQTRNEFQTQTKQQLIMNYFPTYMGGNKKTTPTKKFYKM